MENTKVPAACADGEVKKDWRLVVDPLVADLIDRLFPPCVKGSLKLEVAPVDTNPKAQGEKT